MYTRACGSRADKKIAGKSCVKCVSGVRIAFISVTKGTTSETKLHLSSSCRGRSKRMRATFYHPRPTHCCAMMRSMLTSLPPHQHQSKVHLREVHRGLGEQSESANGNGVQSQRRKRRQRRHKLARHPNRAPVAAATAARAAARAAATAAAAAALPHD